MNLKIQARHIGRLIQESSPTILTAVGVVGVVGTAVLVGKASYEAADKLRAAKLLVIPEEAEVDSKETFDALLTNKEKALLVWQFYLPAVGVGSLTIAAIVMSNRIQTRRLAALAAGYAILSKDFDDYRDQAFEKLGIKKTDELDKSVAAKKMAASPPTPGAILAPGKSWFCDMSSMRYFPSTMETVKEAMNEVNFSVNNQGSVSLNDFYTQLGLDPTTIGDILGWNSTEKLEIKFSPLLVDDFGAVTAFRFVSDPYPKF